MYNIHKINGFLWKQCFYGAIRILYHRASLYAV